MGKFVSRGYSNSEERFGKLVRVMTKKSGEKLRLSDAEQFLQGESRELCRAPMKNGG